MNNKRKEEPLLVFRYNNKNLELRGYEVDVGILSWKNDSYHFIRNVFDICGCMNDEILEDIYNIMMEFLSKENMYCADDKYRLLIYHLLDSKGLIEHGLAIRGSWATQKLKILFPLFDANKRLTLNQTIVDAVCQQADENKEYDNCYSLLNKICEVYE